MQITPSICPIIYRIVYMIDSFGTISSTAAGQHDVIVTESGSIQEWAFPIGWKVYIFNRFVIFTTIFPEL